MSCKQLDTWHQWLTQVLTIFFFPCQTAHMPGAVLFSTGDGSLMDGSPLLSAVEATVFFGVSTTLPAS